MYTMTRKKQDKIKNFRGAKHARKEATANFMAGELKLKSTSQRQPHKMSAIKQEHPGTEEEKEGDEEVNNDGKSIVYAMHGDASDARDEKMETKGYTSGGEESEHSEGEEDEETMLEEDGTQIITPPKQNKRARHQGNEAEATIEQYKAMVSALQAELRNAHQQIRVISKSSLEDKFMAGQVKQYVKQSLWKRCKFITCRETMDECMEEVADHFGITGEKRDHWKSTYEHAVRDALNNRRNNTAQGLKKELTGTCVCNKWLLCRHSHLLILNRLPIDPTKPSVRNIQDSL
jgi:hypothetical protein